MPTHAIACCSSAPHNETRQFRCVTHNNDAQQISRASMPGYAYGALNHTVARSSQPNKHALRVRRCACACVAVRTRHHIAARHLAAGIVDNFNLALQVAQWVLRWRRSLACAAIRYLRTVHRILSDSTLASTVTHPLRARAMLQRIPPLHPGPYRARICRSPTDPHVEYTALPNPVRTVAFLHPRPHTVPQVTHRPAFSHCSNELWLRYPPISCASSLCRLVFASPYRDHPLPRSMELSHVTSSCIRVLATTFSDFAHLLASPTATAAIPHSAPDASSQTTCASR